MFVPFTRRQLTVALALGLFTVAVLPGLSFAGTLSITSATTTGPTQNGLFAPPPNDFGVLNLTNNAWLINCGPGVSATTLVNQFFSAIEQGWNPVTQGTWDGAPTATQHSVISSFLPPDHAGAAYTAYPTAANDPNATTGIGIETGDDYINNYEFAPPVVFYGQPITGGDNQVLIKYTFYGDTGLKGFVDAGDIANGLFGISAHLTGWANDKTDYGFTSTTIAPYDIANTLFSKSAQASAIYFHPLAEGGGGAAVLGVPEPATATLVGIAAVGALLGALRLRKREG
jgi:hypothetical protein